MGKVSNQQLHVCNTMHANHCYLFMIKTHLERWRSPLINKNVAIVTIIRARRSRLAPATVESLLLRMEQAD